jgi:hypothetical protein
MEVLGGIMKIEYCVVIILVGFFLMVMGVVGAVPKRGNAVKVASEDKTKPVIVKKDPFNEYLLKMHVAFTYETGHPVSIENPELIENNKKITEHYYKVSKNIRSAEVNKTDTEEWVITLIDVDGDRASLWLTKHDKLRTISPY